MPEEIEREKKKNVSENPEIATEETAEVKLQGDLFSYFAAGPTYFTVSEITRRIRNVLEENLGVISVRGEISNLRSPGSGHLYFTLKDAESQLTAVLFRPYRQGLAFEPEDGLEVLATGQITVYEPRGIYQLLVTSLDPVGKGALQIAFEQLKEKLAKEGLFDPARKKPLPFLPKKIAVITSPTGAAIRDILNVLSRRFGNLEILLVPVAVQGSKAAPEIVRAIGQVNHYCRDVEVILLARGGGSLEDLWPFNEETVARAIAASRIPLISAVGHEIDFTISDFVADLRAPTPSAAAELVVQNKAQLIQRTDELASRLRQAILTSLQNRRTLIHHLTRRLGNPATELRLRSNRVSEIRKQLELLIFRRLQLHCEQLSAFSRLLQSLNPRAILDRGYLIACRTRDATMVKSVDDLTLGELLTLQFSDGTAQSRVEEIAKK